MVLNQSSTPAIPPRGAPAIQRGGWLDALRFAAATLMIVHHYHRAGPVPLDSVAPVFARGYLLTDFFLIDSGYVLARIYAARLERGLSPLAFLGKRIARLVPAHLAMILGLGVLVAGASAAGLAPRHPEWFDWSQYPAQLFLVQAYGVPGGLGWNAPSWSISALLGRYLAFPWLIRLFGRLSPRIALVFAAAAYLVANGLAHLFLHFPVYQMPLRFGFLRALPLFLVGVALARFSHSVAIAPRLGMVLGVAAAVSLAMLQAHGAYSLVSLALICLMIVAAAAIPIARPSRLVEQAALASFAIFITNEVVRIAYFGVANVVIARLGLPLPLQWAVWAGGIVSAFGFAFAFYGAFDAPSQAWLARAMARGWFDPGVLARAVRARLPKPECGGEILGGRPAVAYYELAVPKGRIG